MGQNRQRYIVMCLFLSLSLPLSVLATEEAISDETQAALQQGAKVFEELMRRFPIGNIHYPQNQQEWQELDKAAVTGPEGCYVWLGTRPEPDLHKLLAGKTWKDLGESDAVSGCHKVAEQVLQFIRKMKEGELLGHLGDIRSALSRYYEDHNGVYPDRIEKLVPKYLPAIPAAEVPEHHAPSTKVEIFPRAESDDSGGWGYVADPSSKDCGAFFINCTHRHAHADGSGGPFNSY